MVPGISPGYKYWCRAGPGRAGPGSAGISIFASINGAKGKESGNGTRWTETTLDNGGKLSLISGRDTTLDSAQVSADQVIANTGRDLTLTSQQDSDRYDSKQTSYGAGGSFTFGSMSVSGYASVNQDKMHSNFDSVQEQSGIYAGNGGFDITVGNHTQLNGAVIASQGDAADNRLDTGTLGFTDIGNAADYRVSHSGGSIALSSGGGMGAQMLSSVASNAASTLLSGLNNNGHAEGTTQSAVANGTVIIRDRVNQKQDVADLSRDTEHANDSISAIFDKEKEQKRLQTAQLAGEISGQMTNIVTTMGDIKGLEKARSAKNAETLPAGATEKQRREWLEKMRDSPEYQAEMKQWGIGSTSQKVAQTVGSILTGLVTGNAGQAVAGGLNPWAAQLIKKETTDASGNVDVATNAMAHAVWGAVSSQMSGGSAAAGAAGAAGAFSGELATRYIAEKYWGADTPEKIAALGQEDREQLSLLGTLAAGLAGGMAGNSSAAATSGAVAGKNAVENNFLGATSSGKLDKAVEKIKNGDKSLAAANELLKLENADKRSDALVSKFNKDPSQMNSTERAELAGYLRVYAAEMEKEYGAAVSQELVKGMLSGQDYIKRNPDSEAMSKAQTIMNTWGYHKSNASIGDAPLIFGGSVLGTTIKEGMALNAAIGVGVNTGVQLTGKDPFSYVDAIMAGVTAAATTGKGIGASAGINMGGAAIGSGIKGENPTNSMVGAGAGTIIGGVGGEVIKGAVSKLGKDTVSDLTGAVIGGYISEKSGNAVKDTLDKKDNANVKK